VGHFIILRSQRRAKMKKRMIRPADLIDEGTSLLSSQNTKLTVNSVVEVGADDSDSDGGEVVASPCCANNA
jgi:hypothetical protein